MISTKISLRFLIIVCTIVATFNANGQSQPLIKNGKWLCVIKRLDGHTIPFHFIASTIKGKQVIHIVNGADKLLVDDITQTKDSILITLPFFNANLLVKSTSTNRLEGFYIKKQGERVQSIPIVAEWGINKRYPLARKANFSANGTWDVAFSSKNNVINKAVGSFVQASNGVVTGSFLTPTGDYRFLEGVVSGDTLQLSGFDGGFAQYFQAIFKNDSTLEEGSYISGAIGASGWSAQKNDNAHLPDEYSYSHLKDGESKLTFTFPNTEGKQVSITDEKYRNKVVIIQILGSWCPNCMDETSFLSKFYNENKQRGIEIIGLTYERTEDYEASKKAVAIYQKRFNVQYPILITGVTPADPYRVEKTLPQIDKIAAFPTSIFIDKKGQVRKIHTGYDGPGTGKFYEQFKTEFNELINELLTEESK